MDPLSADEILSLESYMRTTPLDSGNREEMMKAFRSTRPSRRNAIANLKKEASFFLNKYPRLKDMEEAVSAYKQFY